MVFSSSVMAFGAGFGAAGLGAAGFGAVAATGFLTVLAEAGFGAGAVLAAGLGAGVCAQRAIAGKKYRNGRIASG